jgi:internalin A
MRLFRQRTPREVLRRIEAAWQTLDLSTMELAVIPAELGQLTDLQSLNLRNNWLKSLPAELGQLTNLQTLNLGSNRLTSLPSELGHLANLQKLDLYGNRLTSLPAEVGQLTNLRELDLYGNRLTSLPAEVGQLTNLRSLKLQGNHQLAKPLLELFPQGTQAILAYLRGLDVAEPRFEAKLLLVGDPEAGKSSLVARLRGEGFDPDRSSTHGIELNKLKVQHPAEPVTIALHTWDFGGQPLYQTTHQLFISPQALYLLVWNARRGDAERVDAWLRQIRLLVGDQARVLLVATHTDEHGAELDYPALTKRHGNTLAGLYQVDNRSGVGLDRLRQAIAEQAAGMPHMGQLISTRWILARNRLLARPEPQLAYRTYVELCGEHGMDPDQADALLYLLNLWGQLLHFAHDPDLHAVVILQPEWLTKAISYVLHDPPTRQAGGVLEHARLREIWQDRPDGPAYPAPLHRYLLRLMEQFDVSYRLGDPDRPRDQTSSLIAQLVPDARPVLPWNLDDLPPPGTRELAVRVALTDQAPGLMAWLTVRNHRFTTGRHWRRGVSLALLDEFASEGLLELSADDRELALTVHAPEPGYFFFVLLDSIRQLLRSRWPGLDYDLLVPCQHRDPDRRRCTGRFHRHALVQFYQRAQLTIPCPVCGTAQNVAGLLTAVAAASGPDPGGTVELKAQLIQVLGGTMEQVLRAEIAPITAQLDRIETSVSDIAAIAWITRAQLRLWTIRYETASGTPRLFTLTPVSKHGLDKAAVWKDTYQLTLWCEHDDQPHPWPPARYQFTRTRDWLVTVAPYALGVLAILRLAAKVTMPIATLADVDFGSVKDELEAMTKLLDQLPTQPPDHPAAPDQAAQPVQADGPELRALRALLTELDPRRTFNGMHVVATSSGDIRWVCQVHYPAYNPGLPSLRA